MNFEDRELYRTGRSTNFGHAAVATSEPLAVQAGLAVLRRGGNAVDAAIATAAVLTVTEPVSSMPSDRVTVSTRPPGARTRWASR